MNNLPWLQAGASVGDPMEYENFIDGISYAFPQAAPYGISGPREATAVGEAVVDSRVYFIEVGCDAPAINAQVGNWNEGGK